MLSVQVRNLGKAYWIYDRPIDSLKELVFRRAYHKTFWALRGVDLDIQPGGTLGVVGENGSGKSTLLKLLAGTMLPTEGSVHLSGRVSAILELGTGFHPDLTGLENARIGCAVIGLSPQETREQLPLIVEFSELGSFVERPVKTYSSGMYVRLAFSIMACVEPDVLVIDEALAVGDQHFQQKCTERMVDFKERGKTLVLCSHNLYMIKHVCDQCVWLRKGRPVLIGDSTSVTEQYQDYQRQLDSDTKPVDFEIPVSGFNRIEDVWIGESDGDKMLETGQSLTINVVVRIEESVGAGGHVGIMIRRGDGVVCYGVSTEIDEQSLHSLGNDRYGVSFVVDELPLLAGEYLVDAAVMDDHAIVIFEFAKGVASFRVAQGTKEVGVFRMRHSWRSQFDVPSRTNIRKV